MNTTKTLTAVALVAAAGLTACGSSKASSGQSSVSTVQKVQNIAASAKECAGLLPIVQQLSPVATAVINHSLTPQAALAKIAPVQAQLAKYSTENPTLPVSVAVKKLSDDIAALQKNAPKDAASVKAAVATLTKDGTAIVTTCTTGH